MSRVTLQSASSAPMNKEAPSEVEALLEAHNAMAESSAVIYLAFADPQSCIAAYEKDSFTTLIGFLPLPLRGSRLLDAISAIDENGSRLVDNYRRAFPTDAERIADFDAAIGLEETSAPGWLLAACSLALGLGSDEALEARTPSDETVGLDTFVIEGPGGFILDSRRFVRSVMSYRIGGAPNVVLARSVFSSLGHFVADAVSRLLRDWNADLIVCAGDLFVENRILLENARGGLCGLGVQILEPQGIFQGDTNISCTVPRSDSITTPVALSAINGNKTRPKPARSWTERISLKVSGLVQGVGFRPHVARLAGELGLWGLVGNNSAQVFIEVEGRPDSIDEFCERLQSEAPPLARIESVDIDPILPTGIPGFKIVQSQETDGEVTVVSPDTATCQPCLDELADPANRRYGHPFITCTNCGPRFTIVKHLPYDRHNTTMSEFEMCENCRMEYDDPANRRYHAQPIGCHQCGPKLSWKVENRPEGDGMPLDEPNLNAPASIVAAAKSALRRGAIVAVKGIGGYHLACDATSDIAVSMLRTRKGRAEKPFAVMVADLEQARELAYISPEEANLLTTAARPIVLVRARENSPLSPLVAPGNPLVGILLPNAPIHQLLFSTTITREDDPGNPDGAGCQPLGPLVMTSGNLSGEPICYSDEEASKRLGSLIDAAITHDRPIHLPCDDSVVRTIGDHTIPIRRSRGYAPLPINLPVSGPDILAVGGELKNTFCVTKGSRAWVSQHLGDLENMETLEAFEKSIAQFCELYRVDPEIVVADAHPGYLASSWARRNHGPRLMEVYHHHAHLASVMAEHHIEPGLQTIGIAFDGTGYGPDGTMWGGEVLVSDGAEFARMFHLAQVPAPGGDAGVRHPSRMALSYLWSAGISWDDALAPVAAMSSSELKLLERQLESNLACVPTSSMGRLFDAVSSLIGLRHEISYEAQAAIELEMAASSVPPGMARHYAFSIESEVVDPRPVLEEIIADLAGEVPAGAIAAGFHQAIVSLVVDLAERVRESTGSKLVALSGGVFQNALLSVNLSSRLASSGFDVLLPQLVPANDGGLALGQAFIALARHRLQGGPT